MKHITAEECRKCFSVEYFEKSEKKEISPPTEVVDCKSDLDEILKRQEILEIESYRKREIVFKRVLSCLETDEKRNSDVPSDIQAAIDEMKRNRAQSLMEKEKRSQEARERQILKEQREALRNRFNPLSEDAQGIDPLAGFQDDKKASGEFLSLHHSHVFI